MTLAWWMITCDLAIIAAMAVVGYRLQPDRNPSTLIGWLGVVAQAAAIVVLALRYNEPAYLILLAAFPLGYLAIRLASRARTRRDVARGAR